MGSKLIKMLPFSYTSNLLERLRTKGPAKPATKASIPAQPKAIYLGQF